MKHYIGPTNPMHRQFDAMANYQAKHFAYAFDAGVATLTLNRPERKNPLTFDSYAELRDLFRALNQATDVKTVVLTGSGGNFCSGGDVHEIIGPLTKMSMPEAKAQALAAELASGPTFAHGMTKTMLHQEWAMTLDQAIEAEAQAQAICMQTKDFSRAYEAFAAKQKPVFKGD